MAFIAVSCDSWFWHCTRSPNFDWAGRSLCDCQFNASSPLHYWFHLTNTPDAKLGRVKANCAGNLLLSSNMWPPNQIKQSLNRWTDLHLTFFPVPWLQSVPLKTTWRHLMAKKQSFTLTKYLKFNLKIGRYLDYDCKKHRQIMWWKGYWNVDFKLLIMVDTMQYNFVVETSRYSYAGTS